MYVHGFSRGEDPDALDIRTIDPNSADRFVSLVDRMVADDRRRYDDAEDHEPMEAMSAHPRTPGAFWDGIGWGDQLRTNDVYDGAALRRNRRALGLTQGALAAMVGVQYTSVSHWERGHDQPSAHRRHQIAALFAEWKEDATA